MQYIITFLEGVITFVSPCLLPMLPVYISYFGGTKDDRRGTRTLFNAFGFVLGFTILFVVMGAMAGTLGRLLNQFQTAINILCGAVVVVFGLNYLGALNIPILNKMHGPNGVKRPGFWSSVLFGIVFAVCWTPCMGAFLGSALAMAASQASAFKGVLLLLLYSMGLGIPFLVSAVLIEKLKGALGFIKRNYKVVMGVCGGLLVAVGVLIMTGLMGRLIALLSF